MDDYYKTLGVDKSADEEVIYAAYKALAKKYNPDKGLLDEDKIKIINIAFDILSNKNDIQDFNKLYYSFIPFESINFINPTNIHQHSLFFVLLINFSVLH